MTAWKDTAPQLFAEADAAKEKAKADFLAALRPTNPAVVPAEHVIPLVDAITTAQWKALLKHIGPVSSDGSVAIGISIDPDGVPQLDLKAAAGWPEITVDPSAVGHAASIKTVVWQMSGTTPVAIWIKTGPSNTEWEQLWPNSSASTYFHTACDVDFSTLGSGDLVDGVQTLAGLSVEVKNQALSSQRFALLGGLGGCLAIDGKAAPKRDNWEFNTGPQLLIPLPQMLPVGVQIGTGCTKI